MTTSDSERVLILAPRGRDAPIAARVLLQSGIESCVCTDVRELCREIDAGAGVALVTTEALPLAAVKEIVYALAKQPSWSELPVLVFAAPGLDGAVPTLGPIEARAHITLLDRPVRVKSLISAIRSALLARRRQYQLRNLMTELEERIHERDKFLAILGHELRNPLAAILLASQTVDAADARLDGEHAALIERQSRHLTRLVDDLLDLSRVTAGKIVLQRQTVDLDRVVDQAIASLHNISKSQGVALRFMPATRPVLVNGDPVRLEQIVVNLLTNAVKYTLAGGRADIFIEEIGGEARLRVVDTGVGIDASRISSIFGLFMQAENAIGRARGGMGIGLALVRSLVELHGGAVTVESAGIGQGSEFTVTLPLSQPDQRPAEAPSAPTETGSQASLSILIVEDNSDVRTLMENKLRKLGHAVDGFRDGEDGAHEIASRLPDLALVDLGLPGIDGYEVANRVRSEVGDRVYLVALSGFGQPEDKRRALEAGFDEHITKPADVKALNELLGRVRSRRA
jgi:signal transduction histidine kinase/CheY-like chemotaxis protein